MQKKGKEGPSSEKRQPFQEAIMILLGRPHSLHFRTGKAVSLKAEKRAKEHIKLVTRPKSDRVKSVSSETTVHSSTKVVLGLASPMRINFIFLTIEEEKSARQKPFPFSATHENGRDFYWRGNGANKAYMLPLFILLFSFFCGVPDRYHVSGLNKKRFPECYQSNHQIPRRRGSGSKNRKVII